jgi:hypothetical protein
LALDHRDATRGSIKQERRVVINSISCQGVSNIVAKETESRAIKVKRVYGVKDCCSYLSLAMFATALSSVSNKRDPYKRYQIKRL